MKVSEIATCIARRDYAGAIRSSGSSRLTMDDLRSAVEGYGETIIPAFECSDIDAVALRDAAAPTWSIEAPLRSAVGRSDLSLSLTVALVGQTAVAEIDDLHVL